MTLTKREAEVLEHLARGQSNRTIADEMRISINTLKKHVREIYVKVKVPQWANPRVWTAIHVVELMQEE